eukprot:2605107-Alexandrium_andersonii.AAC.1
MLSNHRRHTQVPAVGDTHSVLCSTDQAVGGHTILALSGAAFQLVWSSRSQRLGATPAQGRGALA